MGVERKEPTVISMGSKAGTMCAVTKRESSAREKSQWPINWSESGPRRGRVGSGGRGGWHRLGDGGHGSFNVEGPVKPVRHETLGMRH